MPRAGFWAIGGADISFGTDGRWYADGEPIANRRIAGLFSRHIRRGDDGGWVIDIGIDRQEVRVDDTPLVVVAVDGDSAAGFTVRCNDAVSEPLDPASLRVGDADVLYCEVDRGERGRMPARFLRPAYYALAKSISFGAEGAVLESCGRRYKLGSGRLVSR